MQAATVCVFFHQAQAKNKQRFSYFWYQSIISGVLMYYFSIRPCGCMGCGCNTNYLYFGWNDAVCHLQIAIQSLQMGVMVNDGKTCLCVCVCLCACLCLCLAVSLKAYCGGFLAVSWKCWCWCFSETRLKTFPYARQKLAMDSRQKDNLVVRPYEY